MFSWALAAFSFTLSPSLMSIGFMLICFAGLLTIIRTKMQRTEKIVLLLFLLFYCSSAVSALYSENTGEALRKLVLKLPILFFPLAYIAFKPISRVNRYYLVGIFLFALYLPAAVSVYNYYSNKLLFDQLILESKPLPIEFGYGIYHIQFSILLAASVLLGLHALVSLRKERNSEKWLFMFTAFLTVCNFIFLHILIARTGLLSLYAGMAILALMYVRKLPLIYKIIGLGLAVLLPCLMYMFSSSLRNRVSNTIEDMQVVWRGEDANDYSFAMRVQAWKNAVQVIQKHPISGVGIGDADSVLKLNFGRMNPSITPSNRKNPHFQFLESAVQSGLLNGILYLLALGVLIFTKRLSSTILPSLALLFFISSCFESILERQASVIGFSVILALAMSMKNEPEKETI